MKKKIMLIDDSVTIHRVIDLCIDKEKYDVVKVFTKDEALNVIAVESPDLILLDNKLGDTATKDVITSIRAVADRVFIILLTGAFDQFDSNLCFLVGADDFIYKPFDAKTLDAKIESGLSGVSQFQSIDESELPTEEELLAAMSAEVPAEDDSTFEAAVTEPAHMIEEETGEIPAVDEDDVVETAVFEAPAEDDIDNLLAEVSSEVDIEPEVLLAAEPELIDEPAVEEPEISTAVHEIELPYVADGFEDMIVKKPAAPSGGVFDGLIEVDEDLLMAEEERRKEEARLAAELALTEAAEPVDEDEPAAAEEAAVQDIPFGEFEGLVEVDEDQPEVKPENTSPEELLDDAVAVDETELTESEQEEIFKDIEEDGGDELDNILDGINEEQEPHDEQVDETLNSAEEALDETVETVLTDIQAELSLKDVMDEQHGVEEEAEIPARPSAAQSFTAPAVQDVKDIDPEPLVRISEEKLVEAVYEAIDEDTLKFAVKEVLTDKITRILEEELPVLVERAIRKEIEKLVKGK